MNETVGVAKVKVPPVPESAVNLTTEYRRVATDLGKMKEAMAQAGSTLLAKQIDVGDQGIHVSYNPSSIKDVPSAEPLTLEEEYAFLYGDQERGGRRTAMNGLQTFIINPDGSMSVSRFAKTDEKNYGWSPKARTTGDELNKALQGLLDQHNALVADKATHSVAPVTVPEVTPSPAPQA